MNDDTLTLYYYNDGLTERERREIGVALKSDKTLALRYGRLCRELDSLTDDTTTPAPAQAVARWHAIIGRQAEPPRRAARSGGTLFHVPSFIWGTAVTAALVVGIGIGTLVPDSPPPSPADNTFSAVDSRENSPDTAQAAIPAAFSRGLRLHLRESQQEIVGLAVATDVDRALLIMNIIEQNRLFERAADQNDSPELARVLRAFEPVLLQLATDDLAPEDAESLQAQLAFELNVMLTKLGRDVSEESQPI